MRLKVCATVLLLANLVLTTRLQAQSPSSNPNALALAERAIAAMGGKAALHNVKIVGSVSLPDAPDKQIPVVFKSIDGGKVRVELNTSAGVVVSIYNNGHGEIHAANGKVIRLPFINRMSHRLLQIPTFSHLAESKNPAYSMDEAADEQIDGHIAKVVTVKEAVPEGQPNIIPPVRYFVNNETGLLLKVEFSQSSQGGSFGRKLETVFSDFQKVRGIAIPLHQVTYTVKDHKLVSDLKIEAVTFDENLSEADFALLPQEAR